MYSIQRPSRSEFVPIRLHRYHVRLWGDPAAEPLVLVHGWMDVAASYQFMVDALSPTFFDRRFIIAPDWRGFGHSTGPACDHYSFADYLGDLEWLLDHYAPGRPVDLVGHSMGGNIAMMYAGVRPERIRRLINLEGFGMPATRPAQAPARYAKWLDEIKSLHRGDTALKTYDNADGVAARLMKTNPRLPPDKAAWLAREWSAARPQPGGGTRHEILGDAAHRIINAQLFRVDEQLALYARIAAPTLMVGASDDSLSGWWGDRFTLAEFHDRLQAVADVRREVLPDSGHMLHHDQPQRLAALVEDFVAGAQAGERR
ncbi:alpha/beta hydrolase [Ottowia sp.]|uniref:alpha/beta fold hydrolase n=1 Tax=Ottowia sp. TaxID=1898956 RepID=UPI002BFAE6A7|nr:alpha/beta hydrolase [Ottowia sp.]HOB67931.1 alpha/beta hydrolase [Ottowia sp.]HPZ58439.1 alpha/beta hydrolase [Ottowia sp.]HQD46999.1 alpha/beta hydrolase [Ottowia sp.]